MKQKYKVGDIVESDRFGSEHKLCVITAAGVCQRPKVKIYRFSYIIGDPPKVRSQSILASLLESYSTLIIS